MGKISRRHENEAGVNQFTSSSFCSIQHPINRCLTASKRRVICAKTGQFENRSHQIGQGDCAESPATCNWESVRAWIRVTLRRPSPENADPTRLAVPATICRIKVTSVGHAGLNPRSSHGGFRGTDGGLHEWALGLRRHEWRCLHADLGKPKSISLE